MKKYMKYERLEFKNMKGWNLKMCGHCGARYFSEYKRRCPSCHNLVEEWDIIKQLTQSASAKVLGKYEDYTCVDKDSSPTLDELSDIYKDLEDNMHDD